MTTPAAEVVRSAPGGVPAACAGGERPDLRLVPAFASTWAAAAWATAASPRAAALAAAGCFVVDAVLVALLLRRRPRLRLGSPGVTLVVLALAAVGVACAATSSQTATRTRAPLPAWVGDRAVVVAEGTVVSDAHRVVPGPARSAGRGSDDDRFDDDRFVVKVRLERVAARGASVGADAPVLVLAGPEWADLTAGQHLALTARLAPTEPGDDVVAIARATGPPRAIEPGGAVWRLADRLRDGLRQACRGLPPDAGGLLPSLVLGDTSLLPDQLREDLRTAGLTHVTAVSGANVAIVSGAVLWLATTCGVRRPLRTGLALAVVAGFVVVARPQPSVLRAAVMGAVALLGVAMSRRPRGVPALAAAGTLLLVFDPWLARSAGFALSCLATAALLLLAPLWTTRLAGRLPLPVAAAIAVPAAAQAACGPVVVLLAPSVSVIAVPANLLAGPAVAPATVMGVLAAVTAPASPQAAHVLAWAGSVATGWIVRVAQIGASLPLAELPWPPGLGGAALLAGLTGSLVVLSVGRPRAGAVRRPMRFRTSPAIELVTRWWPRGTRRGPGPRADRPRRPWRCRRGIGMLLVLAVAVAVGWVVGPLVPLPGRFPWPGRSWPPSGWAVVQCDVGQGAATVIRSGPDRAVLVDTGPAPGAMDTCLTQLGVRTLDLVVLTHFHADHVMGFSGALNRRAVTSVLVSPLAEPSGQAAAVAGTAARAGVPLTQGWAGSTGAVGVQPWSVRWRLLAPVDLPAGPPPDDRGESTAVNEASLVCVLHVTGPRGTLGVIGFGDLETGGQEALARRLETGATGTGGPIDVLVVAHHGSARQVPRLCPLLAPRVAVIGVGAGNEYGHPAPSALRMLHDCGVATHRTDRAGHVAFVPLADGSLVAVTRRRGGGLVGRWTPAATGHGRLVR